MSRCRYVDLLIHSPHTVAQIQQQGLVPYNGYWFSCSRLLYVHLLIFALALDDA